MPAYVFLDTNNWIYLANGYNIISSKHDELHLKVLESIQHHANAGNLIFLVNEIIFREFDNNKAWTEAKIKDIENKAASYVGNLKPIKEFLGGGELEKLEELEKKIKDIAKKRIDQQRAHIVKVEHFLMHSTITIPITDQHHIEASKMALDKKAPFKGDKKNSTADALLILSFVDYIQNISTKKIDLSEFGVDDYMEMQNFPSSYFVSSNSGDFSDPNNREALHADLIPVMERSKSKYYFVVHQLIKDIEAGLLTEEEEEIIEEAEDWIGCEICEHDFARIELFRPVTVFDPHLFKGGSQDANQLGLFAGIKVAIEDPYRDLITGQCDYCGTSYLKCPNCEELLSTGQSNIKFDCTNCHYSFIIHEETDRKGMVENHEYEILKNCICSHCGESADALNEDELCEFCAEYEEKANLD